VKKRLTNRFWFTLHGWLGAQFGLILFVVLFSGSLATVAHEIDWLLNPALRFAPKQTPVGLGQIVAAAEQAYPALSAWFVYAPRNRYTAAEVQMWNPRADDFTEGLRRVYVNPYSGEVQGVTGWFNVQRTLRNFHMGLSMPVIGLYLVGAFGLFLLASVVTALFFYKRWWRRFFVLRTDRGARVFWSDAHRAGGLWSLWFTLVISLTGIWYLVEMAMFDAGTGLSDIPDPPPALTETELASYGEAPERLPLGRLIATAEESYPGWEIVSVYLPEQPDAAVRFTGHADAWLVRDRANNVYVNPYDGSLMGIYRAEDLSLAYRWVHTADPLHFGDFGGLATKLVWAIFGLLSSGLTLTGAYLWCRRHWRGVRAAPARRLTGRPLPLGGG